jgi:hypothetical protein
MQQILRLLPLKLFEKRDLMALLRGDPKTTPLLDAQKIVLVITANV